MSLTSALSAGTSGLLAQSSAMAAISDNIANVNTVGYKRTDTQFSPLVKIDSTNTTYSAGGVQALSRRLVAEDGQLESTSSGTDIGIRGPGFLVVSDDPAATVTSGYKFTRAGSFTADDNGNLINTGGYYLQGWPVEADGTINAQAADLTQLETVNITGITGAAEATTNIQLNGTLEADAAINAAVTAGTYNPAVLANSMAGYDEAAGAGVEPTFPPVPVTIFDSLGIQRSVNFAFLKGPAANPNLWFVEAYISPATDVDTTGTGFIGGQIATGAVQFNSDGTINLASPNTTFPTSITLNASAAGPVGATPAWDVNLGVAAQTIALDLDGGTSTGGLAQLGGDVSSVSGDPDGAVFDDLAGVEVDDEGFVAARFDNGVVRRLYQLPVATFPNPNGLRLTDGAAFEITNTSGGFTLNPAGVAGAGLLVPATLETSTVDLAEEFTGLITTQRAYSAASRVITTTDEMLSELIQIIR